MNRFLWFAICAMVSLCILINFTPTKPRPAQATPQIEVVKCGSLTKIWSGDPTNNVLAIRVLIFRHAPEQMAVNDARLVEQAVEKAATKGLDIKVVGNHLVRDLSELSDILQQDVNKDSTHGDTLIVHTIGHGHGGGMLQNLGQRNDVFNKLVSTAEANKQEMIWWQLSCHAAAHLPGIDTLSDDQSSLFSNLASSNANQLSPAGVQGLIMEKVFVAIAEKNPAIDPNQDEVITANELKNFLNSVDKSKRGDLLFARNGNEVIFGGYRPWNLPIRESDGTLREANPGFIPVPRNPIPTSWLR